MTDNKLHIKSLSFAVRKHQILNDISFILKNNQAVTILGPNGAGKSTLLKSIASLLLCQSGSIRFNGINANASRLNYLKLIGYMPEQASIFTEITVYEQLQFMANIKSVKNINTAIDRVIELCQLSKVINKRTKHLSLGYKQRLNFAGALINQPKLLIMDEPINGLDPHLIIEFRNTIKQLKKECLILISSHYLVEAEIISDRILFMQEGKLMENMNLQNIEEGYNLEEIYLQHTMKVEGQ